LPLNSKLSNHAATVAANAVTSLLDDGYLEIYSGTQPVTADSIIPVHRLVATLRFWHRAFAPAFNGVAAANQIVTRTADKSGTATWFRAVTMDWDEVFNGSVGTSGCNLNLSTVDIEAGAEISISEFTYVQEKD
jgi:hypothetical protein